MVLHQPAPHTPPVSPVPSGQPAIPVQSSRHTVPLVVDVELVVESVDPSTGVTTRRAVVDDGHSTSSTRSAVQELVARYDEQLRRHPEWRAPVVVDGRLALYNDVSRWFFRSPAIQEWRVDLVPTAAALYPIQRPTLERMPSGRLVDEDARAFFTDTLDSIGVRTRAVLLKDAVRRARVLDRHRGLTTWVSLACGAAVPVLDAVRDAPSDGEHPRLELVDHDPDALTFARELAVAQGLVEGRDFRLLRRDLVATMVARATLVTELGGPVASVVDAVGIFEYFRTAACVRLLRNSYELLRPGGVLVVANMLDSRPQLDFNIRGAGWPRLFPRSVEQLVDLVRRAGLPLTRTTISIPQDGVYAVVDVTR